MKEVCSTFVSRQRNDHFISQKGGLKYLDHEKPDILCLQETKCSEKKLPDEVNIPGYHIYWCDSETEGYAGLGLYSKEKPMNVTYGLGNEEFDKEGRLMVAEYEKFYLVNVCKDYYSYSHQPTTIDSSHFNQMFLMQEGSWSLYPNGWNGIPCSGIFSRN